MENLPGIIQQCKWALSDEIKEIRDGGGQKTYISNGKLLGQVKDGYLYSFLCDNEIKFSDDTKIDIEVNNTKYTGYITSVVGFDLIIRVKDLFEKEIPQAILYTAPWFLLEELQTRLTELEGADLSRRGLVKKLLSNQGIPENPLEDKVDDAIEKIQKRLGKYPQYNADQINAITKVVSRPECFIWGPPGTGKSATLGLTAAVLCELGKTVLIVAHSNAAVDVAMTNLVKYAVNSGPYERCQIIRLGPTRDLDLEKYPKLNLHEGFQYSSPVLYREVKNLEKDRDALIRRAQHSEIDEVELNSIRNSLLKIKKQLSDIQNKVIEAETTLLREAKVIGCTLSKATICPDIYNRRFDAVLLDEASMAYIPHCIFSAGLAKEHIAIFGDFRQLAPIAQADTQMVKKWLKRDIFDEAGIIEKVDAEIPDCRLVLLRTQYRMHSQVANIPNLLFYQNRLLNGNEVNQRSTRIVESDPYKGKPVIFMDLETLPSNCFFETSAHSRFNFFSAMVAIEMALRASNEDSYTIGIISPYNAQSRLIRRLLSDFGLDSKKIKASTVHRFQGSERDIIIFDATDGAPRKEIGRIYQDVDASRRMANVAVSRAKGKFIFLCNRKYLTTRLDKKNGFHMILEYAQNSFEKYGYILSTNAGQKIFDQELPGIQYFPKACMAKGIAETDLSTAKEEIAINWPVEDKSPFFSAYTMKLCDPQKIHFYFSGAGKDFFRKIGLMNARFGTDKEAIHYGLVGIDQKILWIYPDPQSPDGFVVRLELEKTVPLLVEFWNMLPERSRISDGIHCSKCNGNMWYDFNEYNQVRMKCSKCEYTRRLTTSDATYFALLMGKTCEKCKGQLVGLDRGSGIFLGCSNYPECRWTMKAHDLFF